VRAGRARNQRSCITARCVALARLTRENASNFARRPSGGAGSATQLTTWAGLRKGPIPKLPALAPLLRAFGSICGGPAQVKCWTCQRNARLPCVGSPPCLWCYIATLKNTQIFIPVSQQTPYVCASLALRPRAPRLPSRRPSLQLPVRRYLVDPASSHMLVSKIKPCMSKYNRIYTGKLRMAH
jgi:hypothetical protein